MMLCMNVLSIIILSLFNYYVFHRVNGDTYRRNLLEYNRRVNELAFENMDRQILEPIQRVAWNYFSAFNEGQSLLRPQTESILGSVEKIRELTELTHYIQNTYPSIESMDIYYEGTGTILTGFDKVHSAEHGVDTFLPWYQAYVENGKKEGFLLQTKESYADGVPVLTYVKTISFFKWGTNDIVLAFHIRPSDFSKYIDIEGGVLTLMQKDGAVIYSTDEKLGKEFTSGGGDGSKEQKVLVEDGKLQYTVFYRDSVIRDVEYVYGINDTYFYQDFYRTNRMFRLNFIISIAFNLLMLLMITYYNYAAYKKRVADISESAGVRLESAGKSFDSSIHALASEINKLSDAVDSSRDVVFQNAVRSMLLNKGTAEDMHCLELYRKGQWACVCVISLTEKDVEQMSVEELQQAWNADGKTYSVLLTPMEKTSLVAVLIFDGLRGREICLQFQEEILRQWQDCRMAFGRCTENQKEKIRASYRSALETNRYFFIFTEQKTLSWEEIEADKRKNSGSHLKLFEALERDMKKEDLLGVKARLEGLVTSFKAGMYTIDYCSSTLRDVVTLFYQNMQQRQLDMWVVFGYDIREYCKRIPNIDQFYLWISDIAEVILKNIHQRREAVDVDIRSEILEIISRNEENELTLDLLASQLNMRPDTASRTFRQVMGKGYTEYMRERRMSTAVKLLEEDMSIKDIAEKMGYSSSQYFIRIFKEEYGMTPYQYKKKLKEKQE
ncbi:MAG: helix-turn-helix transcriptional regulator [Lachnospiraceae bacterium]|nr:helix-turn-helix transcriptional regulator [Lachnospiraceae bacterium]